MTAKAKEQTVSRMNALQEALEAEEHKLQSELFNVRRSLAHLQQCRRQLMTDTPPRKPDVRNHATS